MRVAFADSAFYRAAANPRDELHPAATTLARGFRGRRVTTDFVLIELGNFLARTDDRSLFLNLLDTLRASRHTEIVPASRALMDAGLALYRRRLDKDWSLTDCISSVVMGERGIREALTADHHFEQAGFVALLK
ncbi:MAG TPA: PIN domain-containing protein [Planctomycetota bacterium]|nr:PIN domain-containing protein [Planctomycetota bacterium]HRR82368.1 PIN domain-containing protein [Planctomycetota bacterium]HRT95602.1 PIN domain-containing protein [Planctomycetota bacterium]